MSGLSKRKRSNNFSFTDKELLLKIALSRKTVLENKSSNAATWKDKEKTWEEIAIQYNSQSPGSVCIQHIFVELVISRYLGKYLIYFTLIAKKCNLLKANI